MLACSSDLVAQRGEKLELLIDKTENLVDSVSSKGQSTAIDVVFCVVCFYIVFVIV